MNGKIRLSPIIHFHVWLLFEPKKNTTFSYAWSKLFLLRFKWIFFVLFLAVRTSTPLENVGSTEHASEPLLKYIKLTLSPNSLFPDFSCSPHHGDITKLIRNAEYRQLSELFLNMLSNKTTCKWTGFFFFHLLSAYNRESAPTPHNRTWKQP